MTKKYVLDSCAIVAYVKDEVGATIVESVLSEAAAGNAELYMNKLNLLEVYYGIRRTDGLQMAENNKNEGVFMKERKNAFPCSYKEMINGESYTTTEYGMSLHDYFAGQALAGIVTRPVAKIEGCAELAYKVADAMLKEREHATE